MYIDVCLCVCVCVCVCVCLVPPLSLPFVGKGLPEKALGGISGIGLEDKNTYVGVNTAHCYQSRQITNLN